jgi:DNA-binding SARP family transcriptional activator
MLRLRTFGGLALEDETGPRTGAVAQRRRLVLLAILATAGTGGVSRDRIALLLWSESDADRARHALAQLVYLLRQSLPADAVVGSTTELRLGPAVIASDVAEFDQAVATGDHERAARLYTGPFLDGVHLSDAPEFERWVDAERARRASEAAGALEALALGAGARGDHREAVRWARRRAEFDPLDAAGAVLLMRSLEGGGQPLGRAAARECPRAPRHRPSRRPS